MGEIPENLAGPASEVALILGKVQRVFTGAPYCSGVCKERFITSFSNGEVRCRDGAILASPRVHRPEKAAMYIENPLVCQILYIANSTKVPQYPVHLILKACTLKATKRGRIFRLEVIAKVPTGLVIAERIENIELHQRR